MLVQSVCTHVGQSGYTATAPKPSNPLLNQALSVEASRGSRALVPSGVMMKPSAFKRPAGKKRPAAALKEGTGHTGDSYRSDASAHGLTHQLSWGKVRMHLGKQRSYVQYRDEDAQKWVAVLCLSGTKSPQHNEWCRSFFDAIPVYEFDQMLEQALWSVGNYDASNP